MKVTGFLKPEPDQPAAAGTWKDKGILCFHPEAQGLSDISKRSNLKDFLSSAQISEVLKTQNDASWFCNDAAQIQRQTTGTGDDYGVSYFMSTVGGSLVVHS